MERIADTSGVPDTKSTSFRKPPEYVWYLDSTDRRLKHSEYPCAFPEKEYVDKILEEENP